MRRSRPHSPLIGRTRRTPTQQVETMVVDFEPVVVRDAGQGRVERTLELARHREVDDPTAARADEVMVVFRQWLSQLVALSLIHI